MMIKKVRAFAYYSLFWLAYFVLARIFFLLIQYKETFTFKPQIILGILRHGFKMDISITGYFILLPLLLAIPGTFYNSSWYKVFLRFYTYTMLVITTGIIVTDARLYTYWGFRMDSTPLNYLNTPGDAMASIDAGLIIYFLIFFVIISMLSFFKFNKLILNEFYKTLSPDKWFIKISSSAILVIVMIIPLAAVSGGIKMNAKSVYFSDSLFPNHAAINVVWNTGNSIFYRNPKTNPYIFGEISEAENIVKGLTFGSEETDTIISPGKPNVLLIILESFGSSMTGVQGNGPEITPCFNRMIKEGVYFKNFYATGSRTDKALPAVFSGYPALPLTTIIKYPEKIKSLPGFIKLLGKEGYNTKFWYGGDLNFANIESYIIATGFSQKITRDNFSKENQKSRWGVHDEVLFDALADSLNYAKEPFCNAVLSLSSHEPFIVPMKSFFRGSSIADKFKNSICYTDSVLGDFIERAKKTRWWENTVVIIMADHCRRNSDDIPLYSEEIFRIPMLWLGGALARTGISIDKYCSQTDFPVTLACQLGLKEKYYFGKNILSKKSNSFAFYTFNEGFVIVTDTSRVAYDQNAGKAIIKMGNNPEITEKYGKAYLQVLYEDYLKR